MKPGCMEKFVKKWGNFGHVSSCQMGVCIGTSLFFEKIFLWRVHEHLFQCINESHMGLLYTSLCDQRSTLNWPYLLLGTCHAPGAHATSP